MTNPKKAPAAATQTATPKPPKKLVPRHAAEAKIATAPAPVAEPVPANVPAQAAEPVPAAAPAPETTPATVEAAATVTAQPAAAKAAAPKAAAKRPAKKPSALDEINAKNKKAMVEALAKAQAVKIAQPLGRPLPAPELTKPKKAVKPEKAAKPEKPVKQKKPKLVRDSYAMPEAEYAQIAVLKKRLAGLGQVVKKSELLRGGVAALVALNDAELQALIGRVEKIKTGRPAK